MLFSEAKARGKTLDAAWSDHERKLHSGFPKLFYGTIPVLPVFAIAGDLLQWGMLQPSGQVCTFSRSNVRKAWEICTHGSPVDLDSKQALEQILLLPSEDRCDSSPCWNIMSAMTLHDLS